MIRSAIAILAVLFVFPAHATKDAGGKRYDISYLWHYDSQAVREYKKKVGKVLGPEVAKDLQVVKGGKRFGLIYERNASGSKALRIAVHHTKVLRSRGLDAAAVIADQVWNSRSAAEKLRYASKKTREKLETRRKELARQARKMEAKRKRAAARELARLEEDIDRMIKSMRKKGAIKKDERTAWSVYDFTSGEKLVTINEDSRLQAASMIKPFVAVAFFKKVRDGDLYYGPKSQRMMRRMIQRSNNRATNWLMRHMGGPKGVERILRKSYPSIFKQTRIVEYIPWGGKTYRNKASAHDYSRFLYALWNDKLPGSKEVKRLMGLPKKDRLTTGVRSIPRITKVYSKTGSTKHLCGDMGILVGRGVDGKRYPYTVIGVIQKGRPARNYTHWIRSRGDVIRKVSGLVYERLRNSHNLVPNTEVASR